jgi:Ca2+-binding EF-hand superfamily protein
MRRLNVLPGAAFLAVLTAIHSGPGFAQKSTGLSARVIKEVDSDNDDTITLEEADQAASKRFDRLDTDHDGTLTLDEFQGSQAVKPAKAEFEGMDKDHDGTVSKDEYLSEIARLFKKVDTNGDDKIDAKELRSPMGRVLQILLL